MKQKYAIRIPPEVIPLWARYQAVTAVFYRQYAYDHSLKYTGFCQKSRPALEQWQQAVQGIRKRRPRFPYDRIELKINGGVDDG